MTLTKEKLEFLQTQKGGYTRNTLECIGIQWPPISGWRKRLYGTTIKDDAYIKAVGYSEARAAKRPSLTEQTLLTLD